MTWTDEFATAVRELYQEREPTMRPGSRGVELSLARPVHLGRAIPPVKILIEQSWIDGAMSHGLTPQDAASVLDDRIVELMSRPPGKGPIGLTLLEGRPPQPGRLRGHVASPMYFDVERPDPGPGQDDPEEPDVGGVG